MYHEIYIEEEICDDNPFCAIDPDLDPQPSTMEQRIRMCGYSTDSMNLTIPNMVDSVIGMGKDLFGQFESSYWSGKPDAIYLIGIDKKIAYSFYYYHTAQYPVDKWYNVFPKAEEAIEEAIKDIVEDTEAPVVEVTSPKEGDELDLGGTFDIEWTATDNYSVASREIYLSTDNGANWKMIDSADLNTGGTYTWEVPANNSGECKIKVIAYDRFSNEGIDESGTFSIGPTEITHNLTEAGKRIQFKKTQQSFMIFLPFSGNNAVTVSDVQGKQLAAFITSHDKLWYNVPVSLSSGMHIVSIRTPEKTIVRKFWFIR